MEDQGYTYIRYPPSARSRPLDPAFRYGYVSPADAAAMGYQRIARAAQERNDQLNRVDEQRGLIDANYQVALYGSLGTPGCYQEAEKAIFGIAGGLQGLEQFNSVLALQLESSDILYASAATVEVVVKWSECMSLHGYQFDTWQAARTAAEGLHVHAVDESEIRQAVADSNCRREVGLEKALFEAEAEILNNLIDENLAVILEYEAALQSAVERSEEVLTQE